MIDTEAAREAIERVKAAVSKRIVGQELLVESMLIGLLTGGHILIEGVPGLAKTLAAKSFSETMNAAFSRIQFTPDLLPADLVGTLIYHQVTGEFRVRKGPVFTNILLADEINRAPAKVQSALLESMQERQVTLGDTTYPLPEPYMVLATQNPIEQEGTYPLPEAQVDRFLMKVAVDYPDETEEVEILRRMGTPPTGPIPSVLELAEMKRLKAAVETVAADEKILRYIVSIARATRPGRVRDSAAGEYLRYIEFGISPRAGVFLLRSAAAKGLLENRSYILPGDVKAVAHRVLRHRIIPSYEAEAEEVTSDMIVDMVLAHVSVP